MADPRPRSSLDTGAVLILEDGRRTLEEVHKVDLTAGWSSEFAADGGEFPLFSVKLPPEITVHPK
jgi:hypothetical protein